MRRYVTVEQRKSDNQGVTEDDVNEIKQDISAFRCELIEVLKNSGMNTSTATGVGQGISFGSIRGKLSISSYYYFPPLLPGVAPVFALSRLSRDPCNLVVFLLRNLHHQHATMPLLKLRSFFPNVFLMT